MLNFTQFLKEKTEQPSLPYEEAERLNRIKEKWQSEYDKHADRGGLSHEQIIKKIGPEPVN